MDRLMTHRHIDATFSYDDRTGIITITIPPRVVSDPVRLAKTAYDIAKLTFDGWAWSEFLADGDTVVFRGIPD